MNFGFVKVASAIPSVKVANSKYNAQSMLSMIKEASEKNVELILFPELGITSCSCGDIFLNKHLQQEAERALKTVVEESAKHNTIIVIGMPVLLGSLLFNCAVVLHRGKIIGAVPKKIINNNENEGRWFTSGALLPDDATITLCEQTVCISPDTLFRTPSYTFGIEIGEENSPISQGTSLALNGAEIILNLSASSESVGKHEYLKQIFATNSAKTNSAYIYSGCGYGESSGDNVYGGNALIIENGELLACSRRFSTQPQLLISEIDTELLNSRRLRNSAFRSCRNSSRNNSIKTCYIAQEESKEVVLTRKYNAMPFIPKENCMNERCEEIFSMQSIGLAKRIEHTNAKSCVIGISGGLDSTLALLVTVKAFDLLGRSRKEIMAVTMPGFGTTDRTYNNALCLMQNLGVSIQEVSIKEACIQHFKDIGHDVNIHDTTYENSQARERTQILMDLANRTNGFVIGTGDLSELALGWATYNGDHMSMYGVNASIPKTLVKYLVRWIALNSDNEATRTTLLDIVETPISPELIPAHENGEIKQKTEDLVGPYELHDFFIYHTLRNGFTPSKIYHIACKSFEDIHSKETIKKWLTIFFRRFFTQQFKRSCMPDGPKVGSCNLSPRGDWRMPSDADVAGWLAECERL